MTRWASTRTGNATSAIRARTLRVFGTTRDGRGLNMTTPPQNLRAIHAEYHGCEVGFSSRDLQAQVVVSTQVGEPAARTGLRRSGRPGDQRRPNTRVVP